MHFQCYLQAPIDQYHDAWWMSEHLGPTGDSKFIVLIEIAGSCSSNRLQTSNSFLNKKKPHSMLCVLSIQDLMTRIFRLRISNHIARKVCCLRLPVRKVT